MISTNLKFTGLENVEKQLKIFGKRLKNALRESMDEVLDEMVIHAKTKKPYENRTHKLVNSVHKTKSKWIGIYNADLKGRLVAGTGGAYYAKYVEAMSNYWVLEGTMNEYSLKGMRILNAKTKRKMRM